LNLYQIFNLFIFNTLDKYIFNLLTKTAT